MIVVVIDTSVYVSALVFGGVPMAAVNRAVARKNAVLSVQPARLKAYGTMSA